MSAIERVGESWRDVRMALRTLRRTPTFALAVVLTVGFGVGASTAVFSVMEAALLRPLPFGQPDRLVMLSISSGARLSRAYLQEFRTASRTLEGLAGWYDARAVLSGHPRPEEIQIDRVTTNFFAVLDRAPLVGRTFSAPHEPGTPPSEAVLSYRFWVRRFGGAMNAIGQPITIDGNVFTIVGVMPSDFTIRTNELVESRAEVWVPFALLPESLVGMGGDLNAVGRLAPNAGLQDAQAELSVIAKRIEEQFPSYSRDWTLRVLSLRDATVREIRLTLVVLFAAVTILVLIACVNVVNLILSRMTSRRTELVTRLALGATTGKLVRQFFAEGLALAALGGALGLILASVGVQALSAYLPPQTGLPRVSEIDLSTPVLLYSFGLMAVCALIFGGAPALRAARGDLRQTLSDVSRGSTAGRHSRVLHSAFSVLEVALAMVLLTGAGLLGRSFWNLSAVETGFQPDHVMTLRVSLPEARYATSDRIRLFANALQQRLEALPAVRAVGWADYLPMSGAGAASHFLIEGRPKPAPGAESTAWVSVVGGQYFNAMGIRLIAGRFPGPADTEKTGPVFVIDEALARRHWPSGSPLGARLTWADDVKLRGEIIGVVNSVRWIGVAADPPETAYFWFPQAPQRELGIAVRTDGDPRVLARAIAAQVADLDPEQPVADVRTMREAVSEDLARPRVTSTLFAAFAFSATLIAAVGLYAVISRAVSDRRREIGIRVALGADRSGVLRLVLGRALAWTGAGIALGTAASLVLGRTLAALLHGVTPTDHVTLVAVAMLLAFVALIAAYIPTRRALRLDPVEVLRAE